MSSKGQIVIPQKIRMELEINNNSILAMEKIKDVVVIKKIENDLVNQFEKSLNNLKLGKIKRVA